ncbi:hypothetical protein [Leptolyngbya iicbica]|uniref:Uncharacterized protein n=2 Tax=Cyanophyceae TaxID=3028117 RepID=A0A4V2E2D4_9CYAN|nr:hypothetical protein [Leptolyngbya sp. LK]RZM77966.1 hypothetical protein DYY88_15585 [Leptolyngbya sp. LK]
MAYWEFLLQKEGDRDWLPLETAHVEISEGRYRIIAHSSYCQADVNIRLSRLLTEQMPPQRKTLRRTGTTNENGLMVVIPFTHLTPGHWTVTCTAAQTEGNAPWEFGVQLEVLAIESGVEYWETELDEASLAEQLTYSPPLTTSLQSANQAALPTATATWTGSDATPADPFTIQTPLADLPLRLQLQHQALVAQTAEPLALQGQVMTFSQVEGLAGEGTLWIQLRNPETGAVVHQSARALSIAALPSRFEIIMPLPSVSNTRLLMGELSLWTASDPPQVLAIQGFTVTLNLDALLEVVANQAEGTASNRFEDVATAGDPPDSTPAENTANRIANPLSPRSVPFRQIYLPSNGLTLPPVIYRPIDKKTVGAPTLPRLSNQPERDRPAPNPPDNSATTESTPKPLTLPPLGAAAKSYSVPAPEVTDTTASPQLPTVGKSPSSSPIADAASDQSAATAQSQASTAASADTTFEPDLQGRFWNRLSALAEAAQKAAAEHKAQLEAAGVQDIPATDSQQSSSDAEIAANTDEPINYEVVVYDSDDEPIVEALDITTTDSEPLVEVLQPGEPNRQELGDVPVPEWVFPQGELVAGQPLPITVRLPRYPRRLAVKVWVTDIQSRTLVDRPRWLMNWSPTAEGDQTAFLQLQVPLGSIEAQFEAIAIDLATQQESYKTSLVREILPANPHTSDSDAPL